MYEYVNKRNNRITTYEQKTPYLDTTHKDNPESNYSHSHIPRYIVRLASECGEPGGNCRSLAGNTFQTQS